MSSALASSVLITMHQLCLSLVLQLSLMMNRGPYMIFRQYLPDGRAGRRQRVRVLWAAGGQVPPEAGPGDRDPSTVHYLYRSNVDDVAQAYAGMLGVLMVARPVPPPPPPPPPGPMHASVRQS